MNRKRIISISLIGVIGVLIFQWIFLSAEYSAGRSVCGKGVLETFVTGAGKISGRVQKTVIDLDCPGGGGAAVFGASIFSRKSSVAVFRGTGTVTAYVEKNGVICDKQTKTGTGELRVEAVCTK